MQIMNNQNWFLDMCILIYYAEDNPNSEKSRKALNFVNNKRDSEFVICHYILDINLPKWITRKRIIIQEVKRKIKDRPYRIGESPAGRMLFQKDKVEAEKLFYDYLRSPQKENFIGLIKKNHRLIEAKIEHFIKNLIDKKVIPVSEIDFELKSSLFTYLDSNDSDARTLASAVQHHNKEPIIILTSDKKHWTKQLLSDAVEIHPTLRKKYPKIPEIKYLQNL